MNKLTALATDADTEIASPAFKTCLKSRTVIWRGAKSRFLKKSVPAKLSVHWFATFVKLATVTDVITSVSPAGHVQICVDVFGTTPLYSLAGKLIVAILYYSHVCV